MKKLLKTLDRLVTVAPDTSKHNVGAMYCNYLVLIAYGFGNLTIAKYTMGVFIGLFVIWEIIHMIFNKKPFSIKDIVAAVLTVLPVVVFLIL